MTLYQTAHAGDHYLEGKLRLPGPVDFYLECTISLPCQANCSHSKHTHIGIVTHALLWLLIGILGGPSKDQARTGLGDNGRQARPRHGIYAN
jgi:hypothetical protein